MNGGIDLDGIRFEPVMEDVQTLNELAVAGKLDVSKISYGTLPLVLEQYVLIDSGGALGRGVGPLLISALEIPEPAVRHCTVAIPGKFTTAHVLFSLAYPDASNKVFLRYDEIENYVLSNSGSLQNIHAVKLGVIIHENRFTYEQKGLTKLTDLGNYWESETGLPVPLGGIVVKRSLGTELQMKMQELIRQSLRYAYKQNNQLSSFVRENAQEMSTEVMQMHIDLYVNEFTDNLGEQGRAAVNKFVQVHSSINKIPVDMSRIFLNPA